MTSPAVQPLPLVMTTAEVAKLLRCSPKTVERYVFIHELAAIRIGRERRFRAEDVLEFVATRPTTARNAATGQAVAPPRKSARSKVSLS